MERIMVLTHDGEDFISHIEYIGGMAYLHVDVHHNTPNCFRAVKKELRRLLDNLGKSGYDYAYAYLIRGRYAAMLGGTLINTFESEGDVYEVYEYATGSACSDGHCSRSINSSGSTE